MIKKLLFVLVFATTLAVNAGDAEEKSAIKRAVLDYIESQHLVKPALMERGLDKKLVKRTYWLDEDGQEFVMDVGYDRMVALAGRYNKNGDKFPDQPRVEIAILDIDQRVASVKLTVDDWIDYMHLYKTAAGQWKIINVLWQFHETEKHSSQK